MRHDPVFTVEGLQREFNEAVFNPQHVGGAEAGLIGQRSDGTTVSALDRRPMLTGEQDAVGGGTDARLDFVGPNFDPTAFSPNEFAFNLANVRNASFDA